MVTAVSAYVIRNEEAKSPYEYDQLAHDRFDIRLLRISPDDDNEPVSCTLSRYVEGADRYSCLSYTWGAEQPASATIYLNGIAFHVRPNLLQFLCEARRRKVTSPLWIDAICINQNDAVEREAQVELMSNIFSSATQVIAWLGEGDLAVERAFMKVGSGHTSDNSRMSVATANQIFDEVTPAECDALFWVSSNVFWTRQWIKQELLLPERAILWCGSGSLNLPAYFAAIDALVDYDMHYHRCLPEEPDPAMSEVGKATPYGSSSECVSGGLHLDQRSAKCDNVLALAAVQKAWKRRGFGFNLPSLLEVFKHSECTDFHDYVYAFRGLLHDKNLLQVSYALSPAGLFERTLDFIAQTSHPRLVGSSPAQRELMQNLFVRLGMKTMDLDELFHSATRTVYLVQCGYSFELLRKDTKAWVFAESITDSTTFAAQPWREETTCLGCNSHLCGNNTSLSQIPSNLFKHDWGIWLYGLQADRTADFGCLRAAYEPYNLHGFSPPQTVTKLEELMGLGHAILVLAFKPKEDDHEQLDRWLAEVRNQFVVTVSDRDDAGNALLFSTMPACESAECLLREM